MRRFLPRVAVGLLACLMLAGCPTDSTTVVAPEGPRAAALGQTRDEQIAALTKRLADEKAQRDKEAAEAAKAASSLKGIKKAKDYLPDSRPKEAISQEADVALARLPPDDPVETVKALERAIEMVEGQRDKALADYRAAISEARAAQDVIAAKDKELVTKDGEIAVRDKTLVQQRADAATEQENQRKTLQGVIDGKDKEIQHIKDEQAAKEKRWWVNAVRIVGLGFIVVGAVLIIAFKVIPEGIGSVIVGIIIGLAAIGIDILVNQWWFPWACGIVGLLVLGGGGFALYRMWIKHQLDDKKTQAIQDMIDEAIAKGDLTAVEELKAHLTYRMGDKDSFWGRQQTKAVAALGLVNPKAETAASTPVVPDGK